jgi:putative IMPACT (imprinted ancient) family translation regulator
LGLDKNNFRSSDDGEPSNTAGKPILNQIDAKQLTNIMVVVVRYFGGILLGVQGLVNAYKTATQLALQDCEIIQKQITHSIKIETDYSSVSSLMNFLKRHEIEISKKQIELFCSIDIEATKFQIVELEKFADQNFGKFVIKK